MVSSEKKRGFVLLCRIYIYLYLSERERELEEGGWQKRLKPERREFLFDFRLFHTVQQESKSRGQTKTKCLRSIFFLPSSSNWMGGRPVIQQTRRDGKQNRIDGLTVTSNLVGCLALNPSASLSAIALFVDWQVPGVTVYSDS